MTAYYILTHPLPIGSLSKEYLPATWHMLDKHQGELVAASFKAEVLQGDPPEGIVILRFFQQKMPFGRLPAIRVSTTEANSVA